MRLSRRAGAVFTLAAVVGLLASAGCAPPDERSIDAPEATETAPANADPGADAGWLEGTWSVEHTLDSVSSALFAEEADQGEVVVVIGVDAGHMQTLVDGVTYQGPVVFGGENFRFEGATTYVEDDGTTIESDIILDGVRTGEDSWAADMWGDVRSEGEYLYEATWTQEATRMH